MNQKTWEDYKDYLLNIGVTKKRIEKLKTMYSVVVRALDLETANREQIEAFLNDLNRDRFKRKDGKPFSGSTKSDIKKFLKQYFKHSKGNDEHYPLEVSWIRTRIAKDAKPEKKPVLEKEQVEKLAQCFHKYDYKICTLLLYDSGFRISEMASANKKDLTYEPYEEDKECFWIACNESKTFTRKIPIPLFTTEIEAFFNSSYFKAKGDDDPLFDLNTHAYATELKKYAQELFGSKDKKFNFSPHALRHSSATFYAQEYQGNVPMLAQRFGWSYSAAELQVYVRESGAYNKAGAKISFNNENAKLKEEIRKLNAKLNQYTKDYEKNIIIFREQAEKMAKDAVGEMSEKLKQQDETLTKLEEQMAEFMKLKNKK